MAAVVRGLIQGGSILDGKQVMQAYEAKLQPTGAADDGFDLRHLFCVRVDVQF